MKYTADQIIHIFWCHSLLEWENMVSMQLINIYANCFLHSLSIYSLICLSYCLWHMVHEFKCDIRCFVLHGIEMHVMHVISIILMPITIVQWRNPEGHGYMYISLQQNPRKSWWRHQMEILFALLAHCDGNLCFIGEFPAGQWHEALMFSLICAWINGSVNNREAGDLRRHRAHYDVIVMCMKVKHNSTVCLFYGIYCNDRYWLWFCVQKLFPIFRTTSWHGDAFRITDPSCKDCIPLTKDK